MNKKNNQKLFQEALEKFQSARSILFICHPKPDGDTLGSALSLVALFKTVENDSKKNFSVYCEDDPGQNFSFLPNIHSVIKDPSIFKKPFDLISVLDSGDLTHAGMTKILSQKDIKKLNIVNIDHHATNTMYGSLNLVDTSACSTCAVIFDFFSSLHLRITKDIATCLLTGVLTDTCGFSNLGTTKQSFYIASEMAKHGAFVSKIADHTLKKHSLPQLKLWGRALERLHRSQNTGIVTTALRYDDLTECHANEYDIEGISNFLNSLERATYILVLFERRDSVVKGSLRTTDPLIDVSKIAKIFGGGGHQKAAGFLTKGAITFSSHDGWMIKGIPSLMTSIAI